MQALDLCVFIYCCCSVVQWCPTLRPHGLQSTRPACPHHLLEFAQVHVRCFYLYFQLITALISVYTPSWLFCYCLNLVSFETTKHHFDFLPFLKSTVSQGCCMVEGPGISEAWVLSWFHGILWLAFSASICTFSFQSSGRAGRIHWQPIAWSCKKR